MNDNAGAMGSPAAGNFGSFMSYDARFSFSGIDNNTSTIIHQRNTINTIPSTNVVGIDALSPQADEVLALKVCTYLSLFNCAYEEKCKKYKNISQYTNTLKLT
jgi:hypothetical protein